MVVFGGALGVSLRDWCQESCLHCLRIGLFYGWQLHDGWR